MDGTGLRMRRKTRDVMYATLPYLLYPINPPPPPPPPGGGVALPSTRPCHVSAFSLTTTPNVPQDVLQHPDSLLCKFLQGQDHWKTGETFDRFVPVCACVAGTLDTRACVQRP